MLALIAGQGGLPPHLARVLMARGEVPVLCELEQFPSEVTGDLPRIGFRLETLGTFLKQLHAQGVTRVCLAGAMRRVPVDPGLIDAATAPLVPRLSAALAKGDDGALRDIIALFEERGLAVIGAAEIAPDLLPPAGVMCGTPGVGVAEDIATARAALERMGRADLGQAVLVRAGRVLATEDDRGTDAMLVDMAPRTPDRGGTDLWDMVEDAATAALDWLSGPAQPEPPDYPAEGAILYKGPKPGQELRADMPVIGPATAMKAAEAGLAGIVIETGGVMLLDTPAVQQVLDGHDMFLWVHP
ncbi:MAG: hypothetical protein HLUCCA08_13845 [Rhodobacteraceae bacterium HLUCCA08]|nr:MAG: hypothetical protein HLUCCA08_13845 [Rhodobacteraceae bacterium HLUCCA08]